MARKHEEYDWLDDPFNDKKNERLRMGGGSKAAVGIGCAVAFVLLIVLLVGGLSAIANLAGEL